MREIPLANRRGVVLVDDEDHDRVVAAGPWRLKPNGALCYAVRGRSGPTRTVMHRLILGLGPRVPHVDHIDGNGLNNQRANLRLATISQQNANRRRWTKWPDPPSSRFRGVTWDRRDRCWVAQIKHNGNHVRLGGFHDESAAARAYDVAARQAFGEFAQPNFPDVVA